MIWQQGRRSADVFYVDTHTHLYEAVYDEDRDAVLTRAEEAGATRMIMAAEDVATSETLVAMADRYACLYGAVGIHPGDVDEAKEEDLAALDELLGRADRSKIIAVGEIGLDYY